jgi:hypothetical protein
MKPMEIQNRQFAILHPLPTWMENKKHELKCRKCEQPLTFCFAGRDHPGMTPADAAWWTPTAVTCNCIAPQVLSVTELPPAPSQRRKRTDPRQLEISFPA